MSKIQAAEDLKRLARTFKGLLEFADELEKIGQLENYNKEIVVSHDKLKAETVKLKDIAEQYEAQCQAKKLEASKIIDAANAQADGIIKQAKEKGEAASKELSDKFAARVMKVKADCDKYESAVEAARIELADLHESHNIASAELSAIKHEIAALKSKFGG